MKVINNYRHHKLVFSIVSIFIVSSVITSASLSFSLNVKIFPELNLRSLIGQTSNPIQIIIAAQKDIFEDQLNHFLTNIELDNFVNVKYQEYRGTIFLNAGLRLVYNHIQ
jgi:hypothetical protein